LLGRGLGDDMVVGQDKGMRPSLQTNQDARSRLLNGIHFPVARLGRLARFDVNDRWGDAAGDRFELVAEFAQIAPVPWRVTGGRLSHRQGRKARTELDSYAPT